jgi:hypothetical protein
VHGANKSTSTLLPHRSRPSRRRLRGDSIVFLSILQIGDLVSSLFMRSGEICLLSCLWDPSLSMAEMEVRARWILWGKVVCPEVVDLSLFLDSVDEMRRILVQGSKGRPSVDVPRWDVPCRLQQACSSTHKTSLEMVVFWISQ